MQILYAAPFITIALIAFTICILIPSGRKYAFVFSGATFAFALGALIGFLLMIFITDWVIHAKQPATFWFAISFVAGGLIASITAARVIQLILSRLPMEFFRFVVAFGCLGHLLVLAVIILSGCLYLMHLGVSGPLLAILFATLPLLASLYPTILLTRRSEEFRPSIARLRNRAITGIDSE